MINGDISNETSPRIIVNIDVVVDSDLITGRKVLRSFEERKMTHLHSKELAHLWLMANKYGLSVELAAFENDSWHQDQLDKVMDKLDRRGGNPFNYAELYSSVDDLVSELPYRGNLKGVIDLKHRVMRYGSWGLELENL